LSAKVDAFRIRHERGARIKQVREALGMSGDGFAELLEECFRLLGFPASYNKSKVAKMEGGDRKLTVEEAAVIASVDPHTRGIDWLIFGPGGKISAGGLRSFESSEPIKPVHAMSAQEVAGAVAQHVLPVRSITDRARAALEVQERPARASSKKGRPSR
jgi:hypothetical protein